MSLYEWCPATGAGVAATGAGVAATVSAALLTCVLSGIEQLQLILFVTRITAFPLLNADTHLDRSSTR